MSATERSPATGGGGPAGVTLVGLAGGSGSGKTVLVEAVAERWAAAGAVVVSQDRYYRDWSHLPPAERARVNFDEPAALDVDLLARQLAALRRGERVELPVYRFDTHCRAAATTAMMPAPLVLVEGVLLFCHPALVELFDLRVFVDAPADLRLARRLLRDIRERGRDAEGVVGQYLRTVRVMHDRWVEPQRACAHLVVGNVGPLDDAVAAVEAALGDLGGRSRVEAGHAAAGRGGR